MKADAPQMAYRTLETGLGPVRIVSQANAISAISFIQSGEIPPAEAIEGGVLVDQAAAQLEGYFARERREFDLPLSPEGTTHDQAVWRHLQSIPYGTTTTYGALAKAMDRPGSARAVGLANGRNPIAIIIPCHRVIGANGKLTGYASGVHIKAKLLDLEQFGLIPTQA